MEEIRHGGDMDNVLRGRYKALKYSLGYPPLYIGYVGELGVGYAGMLRNGLFLLRNLVWNPMAQVGDMTMAWAKGKACVATWEGACAVQRVIFWLILF